MSYRERLKLWVETYQGPPVLFVATGGGLNLAQIGTIPGASRVFAGCYVPYSERLQTTAIYLSNDGSLPAGNAVSEARLRQLHTLADFLVSDNEQPFRLVAVTAALTTTRYRRGSNHFWLSLDGQRHHFELPKLTEAQHEQMLKLPDGAERQRELEDWQVTLKVLELLTP